MDSNIALLIGKKDKTILSRYLEQYQTRVCDHTAMPVIYNGAKN